MSENNNILESVVGALMPGGKETTDQLKQLGDQVETKQKLQDLNNQVEGKQEPKDLMENSSLSPGGKKLYRFFRDVVLPLIDPKKEWTGHVDMFAAKCLGITPPTLKEAEAFVQNLLTMNRAGILGMRAGNDKYLAGVFLQSEKDPTKMSNGTFAKGESYIVNYHGHKEIVKDPANPESQDNPFSAGEIIGDLQVSECTITNGSNTRTVYRKGNEFYEGEKDSEGKVNTKEEKVLLYSGDKVTITEVRDAVKEEDAVLAEKEKKDTLQKSMKGIMSEKFGEKDIAKDFSNKKFTEGLKKAWKKLPEGSEEETQKKDRMLSFVTEGYMEEALNAIDKNCTNIKTDDEKIKTGNMLYLKLLFPLLINERSAFTPEQKEKNKLGIAGVPGEEEGKEEEIVGKKSAQIKKNMVTALEKIDTLYKDVKQKESYKGMDPLLVALDLYAEPGKAVEKTTEGTYMNTLMNSAESIGYKDLA